MVGVHDTGRDHMARLEAREWKEPVKILHQALSPRGPGELNDFRLAPFDVTLFFAFSL